MVRIEQKDGVHVLRMESGKANAIDTELLEDLAGALRTVEGAAAVVLTGAGSMFSAGVDLFRVVSGGRGYLDRFLPALGDTLVQLFSFERPVVAAINGHAIAGGCLLACACDYRIMAEGAGRVGVPELLVGVPMPAVPLEVLRAALAPNQVNDLLITGRTVSPGEALSRGLVDEVVPPAEVEPRALDRAQALAAVPAAAFAHTKRALRRPARERMEATRAADHAALAPLWAAPETIEFIRGYLERTVKRSR
jgi:enoyl-CoA hydratase